MMMMMTAVRPELFRPLEDALMDSFFPATFGWCPDDEDTRTRCGISARHGGLAIPDPCLLAQQELAASRYASTNLVQAILAQDWKYMEDAKENQKRRDA
jgi:hypothetical protein